MSRSKSHDMHFMAIPVDTYGHPILDAKRSRHPKCRCAAPCQARFVCASNKHRGSRQTPWCCGGDDQADAGTRGPVIERCSDCWVKTVGRKVA